MTTRKKKIRYATKKQVAEAGKAVRKAYAATFRELKKREQGIENCARCGSKARLTTDFNDRALVECNNDFCMEIGPTARTWEAAARKWNKEQRKIRMEVVWGLDARMD